MNLKTRKPFFSIITVVLNNKKTFEETIKSVFNQSFRNYEYIVVDGGSTDGTLDIIKKNEDKIDFWLSEKDNGIYDAFNKAIRISKGKYIGIINSDDVYTKDALSIIYKYIEQDKSLDFIFGSVKKRWGLLSGYRPYKIHYSWGFYTSHSTGFFIKKNSADKIGEYNTKYKIHADYDYFYRMIVKKKMKGISTKKNEITGYFRSGGYSSKISFKDSFKEELLIRWDNGQNVILLIIIFLYKLIKNYKKFIIK